MVGSRVDMTMKGGGKTSTDIGYLAIKQVPCCGTRHRDCKVCHRTIKASSHEAAGFYARVHSAKVDESGVEEECYKGC